MVREVTAAFTPRRRATGDCPCRSPKGMYRRYTPLWGLAWLLRKDRRGAQRACAGAAPREQTRVVADRAYKRVRGGIECGIASPSIHRRGRCAVTPARAAGTQREHRRQPQPNKAKRLMIPPPESYEESSGPSEAAHRHIERARADPHKGMTPRNIASRCSSAAFLQRPSPGWRCSSSW